MTEITVAGETFNVRLEGDESNEVLALAHQLGGSLAVWEPLMPALLERFRVLRWDSRGHGASVANAGPYSIARLAQDAIGIFDALGVDRAHWLGLSMGAMVGQAALIASPERIGCAVLANTAAQLGTPDVWNARIQAVLRDGMKAIAGDVAGRWFTAGFRRAEPEIVEAILCVLRENAPEGYAAACAAVRDADQREAIRAIRNKVLVIAGRDDSSAPPDLGAYVASAIEGAKFVSLNAAHISHLEQTDAFLSAAIAFLTAPEPPARPAPAPRKAAARRRPARLAAARQAPPKTPAPTDAVKKALAKQTATKKAPAKKTSGKAAVKQLSPAKKTAPTKTAPTKNSPTKAAVKKSPKQKSAVPKAAKTTPRAVAKKAAVKRPVKKAAIKQPKATAKASPAAPGAKAGQPPASKRRSTGKPPRRR
jgi:3-oxoadipate enol-lactonase